MILLYTHKLISYNNSLSLAQLSASLFRIFESPKVIILIIKGEGGGGHYVKYAHSIEYIPLYFFKTRYFASKLVCYLKESLEYF